MNAAFIPLQTAHNALPLGAGAGLEPVTPSQAAECALCAVFDPFTRYGWHTFTMHCGVTGARYVFHWRYWRGRLVDCDAPLSNAVALRAAEFNQIGF